MIEGSPSFRFDRSPAEPSLVRRCFSFSGTILPLWQHVGEVEALSGSDCLLIGANVSLLSFSSDKPPQHEKLHRY